MNISDKGKELYKNRFKKLIAKKFDTTMIFALSQFEMAFGHLWGHGKDDDELTADEAVLREKWLECRNNILNNGNHQKRNFYAEADQHEIVRGVFTSTLLPVEEYNKRFNKKNKE